MYNSKTSWNYRFHLLLAVICLSLSTTSTMAAANEGLILQVSDSNPKSWNLALNIAKNAPTHFKQPLDIVVVAFGPGLKMLTLDSKVANRLETATNMGVKFRACGSTMKKLKLKDDDLFPSPLIQRVKGGVVEIMRLQKAGYAYVRP